MKIYVIRHGKTELNKKNIINGWIDDTLALEGIEQAKAAGPLLPKTIKRIYSSSLARARQTAEILNGFLGVPLTFHDELKEVSFGDLNGKPFLPEYQKRHMDMDYDWRPSGESVGQVKERVLRILRVIKTANGDGEALIVGHGGIVRMMHFLETGEPMGEIGNAALYDFDLDKILK